MILGMIASASFWPRLVHANWSIDEEETRRAVEEAVLMIVRVAASQLLATEEEIVSRPIRPTRVRSPALLTSSAEGGPSRVSIG